MQGSAGGGPACCERWWTARFELGRPEEAKHWLTEALELSQRLGDRRSSMFTLARLARVAAEVGQEERAGLIWGAIEAEERRATHGNWDQLRDDLAAPVLAHADEPAFERGRLEGQRLSLDDVVTRALAEPDA